MFLKFSTLLVASFYCFAGVCSAQANRTPKDAWYVKKATDQDNNLVFITVNMGYKNYAYKAEFPWCLAINIPIIKQNRNGHPVDEEATVLNATQEIITTAIQQAGAIQYVGRATVKGYREIYYYVADPEKVNAALTKLAKTRQPRAWEYQMQEDEKWQRVAPFFGAASE